MSAAPVSPDRSDLRARARAVRDQFDASGTNISEWARERGFNPKLIMEVLSGERRCVRGASHRAAVALGIKPDAAPPAPIAGTPEAAAAPAPAGYDRIDGARP